MGFLMWQMREFDAAAEFALLDGEWPDDTQSGAPPAGVPAMKSTHGGVVIWATKSPDDLTLTFWREDLPSIAVEGI